MDSEKRTSMTEHRNRGNEEVAQIEGVENCDCATQHRSDGSPHRFVSVGRIDDAAPVPWNRSQLSGWK